MGASLNDREVDALRAELEHFRRERERIRELLGCVGGKTGTTGDAVVNVAFVGGMVFVFGLWLLRYLTHVPLDLPPMLSLELGVLLVSLKIVWMIHRQTKVEHFQFWILSSIEFRLNSIAKQLAGMDERSRRSSGGTERGAAGGGEMGESVA
jgi:hypothetical protein